VSDGGRDHRANQEADMSGLTRRQILELIGVTAGAGLAAGVPTNAQGVAMPAPPARPYTKPDRPVTAVVIGHGGRGGLYAGYAQSMPDEWKIVGVAEPIDYRREACVRNHGLAADHVFTTWEHVFNRPKLADVAVITTQDAMHFAPAMAALDRGYDLLLEKPIAPSWDECRALYRKAQQRQAIVAICHVLRYAPYYVQLHRVIESGLVGQVVSVQHMEPVGHVHMSHSYVRGPWRRKDESTPIILAKSCHDLDVLRWWVGAPCARVSAFGSLTKFRADQAPQGAPAHCLDGCPVEATCPYHAGNVYVHKKRFSTHHIVTPDRSEAGILAAIRQGQYGRCVYHCDNDVPDHMVTNLEFQGGTTAALSVEGCTTYEGRRTRVMGTKGTIVGDEQILTVALFEGGEASWDVRTAAADLGGHGGGDQRMVRDLVQAVAQRNRDLLPTTLQNSMESHLMGFMAEESRLAGGAARAVRLRL
jgi:predicted dehydrogenase